MRTPALLFLLTLALAAASCKRADVSGNQNSANAPAAAGKPSSVPPFPTKEPERYQGAWVVTLGENVVSRTFIARDGERRRDEYEEREGVRVVSLHLPEGSFVLLPAKKLYADLRMETGGRGGGAELPPDFSPEKLLNESRPETVYERLGEENLDGRQVVKYRVTVRDAGRAPVESLVWVDEQMGMPVKSETTSFGKRLTIEMRDVKETVDAGLLELPADYKKVTPDEFYAQVAAANEPGP